MLIKNGSCGMELGKLTLEYWRLSRIFNGQSNQPITTQGAIKALNLLKENLGPKRRLRVSTANLMEAVIRGKHPKQKTCTVTQLSVKVQVNGQ